MTDTNWWDASLRERLESAQFNSTLDDMCKRYEQFEREGVSSAFGVAEMLRKLDRDLWKCRDNGKGAIAWRERVIVDQELKIEALQKLLQERWDEQAKMSLEIKELRQKYENLPG